MPIYIYAYTNNYKLYVLIKIYKDILITYRLQRKIVFYIYNIYIYIYDIQICMYTAYMNTHGIMGIYMYILFGIQ